MLKNTVWHCKYCKYCTNAEEYCVTLWTVLSYCFYWRCLSVSRGTPTSWRKISFYNINMEKILKEMSKMKLCYSHHYPYHHYIDEDGCEIYNTALFVKESEQDWISGAPFSHNWIHFNRECCQIHHHHCHELFLLFLFTYRTLLGTNLGSFGGYLVLGDFLAITC